MQRHMRDTVVILEEVGHPLPRWPKYDMIVAWRVINGKHQATAMCCRGEERRRKRRREKEEYKKTMVDFQAYGIPLVSVSEFKYLWRVLTALDDDWPSVEGNLWRAQKWWAQMLQVLGREGSDPRTARSFYNVVVQAALLFCTELWVTPHWIGRTLGGFYQRVARWMVNMHPKRDRKGRWIHPPLDRAIKTVVLEEAETHVLHR